VGGSGGDNQAQSISTSATAGIAGTNGLVVVTQYLG
jgi:hypothetical protein